MQRISIWVVMLGSGALHSAWTRQDYQLAAKMATEVRGVVLPRSVNLFVWYLLAAGANPNELCL